MPLGEDRAFLSALRRVDARIRHAPEVRVVVSGRTIGRAVGGMADTIRRRMIKPDETIDDRLEPAEDAARRAHLRNQFGYLASRREEGVVDLAKQLQLHRVDVARALSLSHFGAVFAELELQSSGLAKRKVAVLDLEYQIRHAASF